MGLGLPSREDTSTRQHLDVLREAIASAYPSIRCNVAGYNLRELVTDGRARYLIVPELREGHHGRYTPLAQDWVGRYAPKAEVLTVGPISNTHDEAVAAVEAGLTTEGLAASVQSNRRRNLTKCNFICNYSA